MNKLTELIEDLCPEGVEYKPVGELCTKISRFNWDKSPKKIQYVDLTSVDIPTRRIITTTEVEASTAPSRAQQAIHAGDVLFGTTRPTQMRICMVPEDYDNQVASTGYCVLRADKEVVLSSWFFYILQTDAFARFLENNQSSGSYPAISNKKLKEYKIPVPPLEVQQEIVRVLDAFIDLEQNLVAELGLRQKQFEFYRGQLFHFDHSVEWSTLGDVSLKVTSGGTPSSKNTSYYGGDIPWLRTQEVNFEDIYSTGVSITEEGLNSSAAKWIPVNCVIVAMYGATAAKSAINAIPLTTNQACCNLEIDPSLAEYRFVYYWVSHMYEDLKKLGEGSQSNLNAKKVKSFPVPVPPLETQREIIDKLCEFESLIQSTEREIALRRKQYEFYRDELLTFTPKGA